MLQKGMAELLQINCRRRTCCLPGITQAKPNLFETSINICLDEYLTYYYLNEFPCQVFGRILLNATQSVNIQLHKPAHSKWEREQLLSMAKEKELPSVSCLELHIVCMDHKALLSDLSTCNFHKHSHICRILTVF